MEQLYRFVKVSERLPELKQTVNCNISEIANLGYFHQDDVGHKLFWSYRINSNLTEKAFNVIEWLEPIESKEFKDLPDNYKDESDLGDEFNEVRGNERQDAEDEIRAADIYMKENSINPDEWTNPWTMFAAGTNYNKGELDKVLEDNSIFQRLVVKQGLIIKQLKSENEELRGYMLL